jgi:hypothetical protein
MHFNIILCFWAHLDSCSLFWTHFRGAGGFVAPSPGRHISTFRGYLILFSIRNPYINRFTLQNCIFTCTCICMSFCICMLNPINLIIPINVNIVIFM